MMAQWRLFWRLMVRPMGREPVRTILTVAAVALGVAVVLAMEMAGDAATGSFHSSLETLVGDNTLEVTASGGIPERLVGMLAALPYPVSVSPRLEDYALISETKRTLPLIGIDLVGEGSRIVQAQTAKEAQTGAPPRKDQRTKEFQDWRTTFAANSIWVGESLGYGVGQRVTLVINDHASEYVVRGTYPDGNGTQAAIVMDIAAAQRALSRFERVDRVLLKLPNNMDATLWAQRIRAALPPGIDVRPQGTESAENRQMLAAFRWNLRLLSYISLVVGAFLIYNTISVSVVRRRAEIGITRALGASRMAVLSAFLGEAAAFGIVGGALSLPLGRAMAIGAVKFMSATVQSLYVSSRPGDIALSAGHVLLAFGVGVGVSLLSAFSPAHEAAFVTPVQAMARGRREYEVRVSQGRNLLIAAGLALAAMLASRAPAIYGKPLLGYCAALLLLIATALAIPAFVATIMRVSSRWLGRRFGAEALLASRSLGGSLRRTSVLVASLATAIAMMVSIGIMVGSFRETVVLWMEQQLPADLYVRPAGDTAADRHPTLDPGLAEAIAKLPGVAGIDQLRAYEITYQDKPVMLGGVDLSIRGARSRTVFFSGRAASGVLAQLRNANNVIVSEPFLNKHAAKVGDTITLALGAAQAQFRIIDAYYDYSSERGEILMDRSTLLRYLPDPAPSNVAVYVAPEFTLEQVRREILQAAGGRRIAIFSDVEIRAEAIRIFDRTFAITYAMEAVAVMVAVMGIGGALLALVMDRRRELGLLRFLGAPSGQIRKLILIEAGLLGLLANAAGALLGYFLSLILIFVVNKQSFGWTIQFHWPIVVLLGALSVVFAATILAGLYPARIAVRMNPLEVVHED